MALVPEHAQSSFTTVKDSPKDRAPNLLGLLLTYQLLTRSFPPGKPGNLDLVCTFTVYGRRWSSLNWMSLYWAYESPD